MAVEDVIARLSGIPVEDIRASVRRRTTDVPANPFKTSGNTREHQKIGVVFLSADDNPLKTVNKKVLEHQEHQEHHKNSDTREKRTTVGDLITRLMADFNALKTEEKEPAGSAGTPGTPLKPSTYGLPAQWERNLCTIGTQPGLARGGGRCIAAALRFIHAGWAEQALALGWTELELVGADPQAPWERLDRRGAAYSELTVVAVTAEHIVYAGHVRRRRGSQADGAKIPWKLETQPISDDAPNR